MCHNIEKQGVNLHGRENDRVFVRKWPRVTILHWCIMYARGEATEQVIICKWQEHSNALYQYHALSEGQPYLHTTRNDTEIYRTASLKSPAASRAI